MYIKVTNTEELKQLFEEMFLNKTDKVTKISDHSVMNGAAYGISKVAQKVIKEAALVEAHLYPDVAYGEILDEIADNFGIAPRFGASKSSMFLKVVAAEGTIYLAGTNEFRGNDGITFELENHTTIGANGYEYIKVRSKEQGSKTNVEALTVNRVSSQPTGHLLAINEYRAIGGRDIESDDAFRKRIKEGSNILARGTLSMIEQAMMLYNDNVQRVFYSGIDVNGKVHLKITTQNQVDLTSSELETLLEDIAPYMNLVDLKQYSSTVVNVVLENADYEYIDFSFRISLNAGYDADSVRKEIQTRFTKVFNPDKWDLLNNKVEWDNLLELVKKVRGVKYVPDNYFLINSEAKDFAVELNKFPKVRGFIMYDTTGVVLSDNNNQITPAYYPNQPDFSFQSSVIE